jgi:hypothetical protein
MSDNIQAHANPARIKGFIKYFNSYLASVFVAAIPAPISQWDLIPIPSQLRGILSVSTPIFCFLTLGFLFFSRHRLARLMFPEIIDQRISSNPKIRMLMNVSRSFWYLIWNLTPLGLIIGCFDAAGSYYFEVTRYMVYEQGHSIEPITEPLFELTIMYYYILTFVLAEGAFVWMAMKEYIQDVLEIDDRTFLLSSGQPTKPSS